MSFRMKSIGAARNGAGKSEMGGGWLRLALAAPLAALAAGCGGGASGSTSSPPANASQLYYAPRMDSGSSATYAIDHTAETFVRSTYGTSGETITDAGTISTLSDGVVDLSATYIYGGGNGAVALPNPVTGSWAVELPGQAALVELDIPAEETSQGVLTTAVNYFTPAVPTQSCPRLAAARTFQFVTIPNSLAPASSASKIHPGSWNPNVETAYGSVKIATSGTSVEFSGVSTYNFSGVSCMATAAAGATSCVVSPAGGANQVASVCSPTYYGQVISVPATSIDNNGSVTPTATIGLGPSGFLVEDADPLSGAADPVTGLQYENILGAGYGAIGLPQPSSDLTSALVGAQYQGFLYSPGPSSSAFSLISSFGAYTNQQTSCATFLGQLTAANLHPSSSTVYGGEFAGNNPSSTAMNNCDLAVDLGTQSANGLYTNANVYVGAAFPMNGVGAIYSFPAVAVAGQLQGKNVIFLIGADTAGSPSRAWGIYLLQSN